MKCKYITWVNFNRQPTIAEVGKSFNNKQLHKEKVLSILAYANENELPFWIIKFSDNSQLEVFKPVSVYYEKE